MKTRKLHEARENAGDQVLSVFIFASDWSKERRDSSETKTIPGPGYFPHLIENCSGIEYWICTDI